MQDENDEITLDTEEGIDDSVVAEEAQGETIKKLRGRLKDAEQKAKEHLDNWQRAQAEFVNLRKRDEESKVDFLKFANATLIKELLSVVDACDQAVEHGHKDVEPIQKLLVKILKQEGVEEINPVGEPFNPSEHEAVGSVKAETEAEDHTIADVLQKGYNLAGKNIRPAKVRLKIFN